ncbi:MAG: ferrochelatase [Elusimicrobiota bacterium]
MDGVLINGSAAVLLAAYGAAENLDEVPGYLRHVLGGREVPERLVSDVRERYRAIGGRSPLVDITRAQAGALEAELGAGLRVRIGMKHSAPTIRSAVEAAAADGCRTLVVLAMSPYYSKLSVGAYLHAADGAAAACGGGLRTLGVESWHDHPQLIEALADRVREAGARVPAGLRPETALLMTAHSLPERAAPAGDPYPESLRATAEAVARKTGFTRWSFAYQSRGGSGKEAWLGPDAGEVLEQLARDGIRSVILSPIGYLAENLETLYDDDILYRAAAEKAGMRFERAAALNDHPRLIAALADIVRGKLAAA